MSQFETLLAGSGLTVVGGFLATLLQMWYARRSASEIRRDERRERALIELNAIVTTIYGQLLALYRRAEGGQNAAQHNEARQYLDTVAQHWESRVSGIVSDPSIVRAYLYFNAAVQEGLPGSGTLQRVQELSSGEHEAGRRFLRDLGHVVGTLDELRKAVHEQVELLHGKSSQGTGLPVPRKTRAPAWPFKTRTRVT
jgi:hypothetical protein